MLKYSVLGREVDVSAGHLWVYFSAVMIITLAVMLISAAIGLTMAMSNGQDFVESFLQASILLGKLMSPFSLIIMSAFILWLAPIFKMKKDLAFCRSMAGAAFVFGIVIAALASVVFIITQYIPLGPGLALDFIVRIISSVSGAIVLYLALLILLNPERKRLEDALTPAAILALAVTATLVLVPLLVAYQQEAFTYLDLQPSLLATFASYLVIGAVVLYHTRRKLDMKAAYLFAGAEILTPLISLALRYVNIAFTWSLPIDMGAFWADAAQMVAVTAVYLVLLYYFSTKSKD
jgi:hypothetical protein